MPDEDHLTVWHAVRRQALVDKHGEHLEGQTWDLEHCEYCRTEYYMLLPPLGAPDVYHSQ